MSNIHYFIVFSSFLICSGQLIAQSHNPNTVALPPDSVVHEPGYFRWSENTVITIENAPASKILKYQEVLDHTNTDFNENPESVVIFEIGAVSPEQFVYVIGISQDTIRVTARLENDLKTALQHLRKMKLDAEKNSPDYGLIYLECGKYWRRNF